MLYTYAHIQTQASKNILDTLRMVKRAHVVKCNVCGLFSATQMNVVK